LQSKELKSCIENLRSSIAGIRYGLYAVINGLAEEDSLILNEIVDPDVQILKYVGGRGVVSVRNWAVSQLLDRFSHFLFYSPTLKAVGSGWLERMLEIGQWEGNAIVGAKLIEPYRATIQDLGICIGVAGGVEYFGKGLRGISEGREAPGCMGVLVINREVSAVSSACMLVHASEFTALGGFDESYPSAVMADVEFCHRAMERGSQVICCAHAVMASGTLTTVDSESNPSHRTKLSGFRSRFACDAEDYFYNPGYSKLDANWNLPDAIICEPNKRRRVFEKSIADGSIKRYVRS
jgi:hypothetical protein